MDCLPGTKDVTIRPDTRRVSFAAVDNTIGDLTGTSLAEKVETPFTDAGVTEPREGSPVPPPGFRPFEWPEADWNKNGDLQRDPGLKFVASWSAKLAEEEMSSPPPLEAMSPIPMADGQDSMTVHVGTPELETVPPVVVDQIRSVHRRRARKPSSPRTNGGNPASGAEFLFKDILCLRNDRDQWHWTLETIIRFLDGVWPVKDHFRMNVRRPPFVFWGKVALSDTLRMNGRITPTEGWSRHSVESPAVSGMAGDSGHSLATGDEPRTLVWHVIQRPSFDGGHAATQGCLSYANELRHSRPVRTGIARNGNDPFATNNRGRLFSGYGGTDGGPRGTRTQGLCTNGGARTVETYVGP